jgi:formamidopyrimidine-DNA glycosylase
MPELPEVEHVVRGLQGLAGRRICSLELGDHHPPGQALREQVNALAGARIERVGRRGKWIVLETDQGQALIIHLRMTGSLLLGPATSAWRWTLHLAGRSLTLMDPRSFGTLHVMPASELEAFFAKRLGREPVDERFDGTYLARHLTRRTGAIKSALLDQKVAAGAGNIYVDEALWSAKVHPLAAANTLSRERLDALASALVAAVQSGLARGGSSVRNYVHADGTTGTNQNYLAAYGRAGKPCLRCAAPLEHGQVGGRGSVWCPVCQKTPQDGGDAAMMDA